MVSREGLLLRIIAASVVFASAAVSSPSHASQLLRGHVEEPVVAAPQMQAQPQPQSQPQSGGAVLELRVAQDSFPESYEGTYHCVTTVVDTAVATVPLGQVTHSEIEFKRTADGRTVHHWNQPGWTETQSAITTFNSKESRVDRTSYFFGENMQGAWAARTRDQFTQVADNSILAKSYVDQYIDGQYLGRYRTTSVLQKTSGPNKLALAK